MARESTTEEKLNTAKDLGTGLAVEFAKGMVARTALLAIPVVGQVAWAGYMVYDVANLALAAKDIYSNYKESEEQAAKDREMFLNVAKESGLDAEFFKNNIDAIDYAAEFMASDTDEEALNAIKALFADKDLSSEAKIKAFNELMSITPPETQLGLLKSMDMKDIDITYEKLSKQLEEQKKILDTVDTYSDETMQKAQKQADIIQKQLDEVSQLRTAVLAAKQMENPNAQDTQVVDTRGNVPLNEAEQMGQNIANRVQNKQELNAAERVYLLLGDNTMPYHQKAMILDAYFQRLSPQEKEAVAKQIADDVKQAKLDFHKASISVQQAELGQSKQDLSAQDERERQMLKDMDKDMAKNLDKAKDSMKTAENKLNYHSEKQALFDVLANYGNINKQAQAQNNAITEKANKDIASASGADSSAMDKLEANANKMPHPTNESVLDETQENRQVNKYRQA